MQALSFLANYLSPRRLLHLGLFCILLSCLVLWNTLTIHTHALDLIPGALCLALGGALLVPRVFGFSILRVMSGTALAMACGFIVVLSFVSLIGTEVSTMVEQSQLIASEDKAYYAEGLMSQVWSLMLEGEVKLSPMFPVSFSVELAEIVKQAVTHAAKQVLAVGSLLTLFGFVATLLLYPEPRTALIVELELEDDLELDPGIVDRLVEEIMAIDQELTGPWQPIYEPEAWGSAVTS